MPTEVPSPFLFVITRADSLGGAQIHVRDLALEWSRRGAEVHVAVGQEGELSAFLRQRGLRVHPIAGLRRPIRPWDDLQAIRHLRCLYRALRPALVSAHTAKAGMVARLATLGLRDPPPVIYTAHGWQFAEGIGPLQRLIVFLVERICAPLSRRIVTVSDHDYALARGWGIARPPRLIRIHNGMPDRPAPLRPTWDGQRPLRLIMVARFQEQKDHPTLLQALTRLRDRPWKLTLVGDGPLLESVRGLAQRLGLLERVEFLGQRWDVPELLEASDVFFLISRWEGFPRSILEAMRAALPVIATGVGGVRESVVHGVTGWVVPVADAEAVARGLAFYFTHPQALLDHGREGRKLFEHRFRFQAMAEATLMAYAPALPPPALKRLIPAPGSRG